MVTEAKADGRATARGCAADGAAVEAAAAAEVFSLWLTPQAASAQVTRTTQVRRAMERRGTLQEFSTVDQFSTCPRREPAIGDHAD
jgi:3-hydroxyisobutyrate dehydrogenase-like beta-hydroxyacid dehydrogenase